MKSRSLINTIKTLLQLQNQMKVLIDTMNRIEENESLLNTIKLNIPFKKFSFKNTVNAYLSNYSIIIFCSFLEEYNQNFIPAKFDDYYKDRIINVKKKNKPGVKRINEWNGLINFRNQLVAHSFDIKGKSFFSSEIEHLEFKIPNTISEKNLFYGIVYLMCVNISEEFYEIILEIQKKPNEIMLDKMKIVSENIDSEKELNKLLNLMR